MVGYTGNGSIIALKKHSTKQVVIEDSPNAVIKHQVSINVEK